MKIAFLAASVSRQAGGLYDAVRRLAAEQAALNRSSILVFGLEDRNTLADLAGWQGVPVTTAPVRGPRSFGYAPQLLPALQGAGPDLVHQHGLWMYPSVACRRWSARARKPYIVSPRGMLEPWALRYHYWKKLPTWLLWERRHLDSAAILHATSEQEATNIRALGLRGPIAVIPNGVEVPDLPPPVNRAHEERRAVFLSRIHPKKGLLNLIEAWRQVRPHGWSLLIAGPDESNHLSSVQAAARQAGLTPTVKFVGPVYGQQKLDLLNSADLFILPTFSENFGIVVAEALASAVPVITTKGAPWKCLETHGCGWWVDVGVPPLARALSEAIQCSQTELRQMGLRGRHLVAENFAWPRIARQIRTVYEWCLGGGPRPDCFFQE